ncbi:MAG TPA: gamma-glutamyl-phosphate reductase, partial [bacterium]|nr:gamma-glutamyl-phosphate reductase [bacterium]
MIDVLDIAKNSKESFFQISNAATSEKNNILKSIKLQIIKNIDKIIQANEIDMNAGKSKGLNSAMLDRLLLNDQRIKKIAESIDEIIMLEDPVGEILNIKIRPNGLKVGQMRVPIGSILIIYEARPNVTVDAAALCLKSENAMILKNKTETINTNHIFVDIIKQSLIENNF